jgi:hypothetical protein
MADTESQRKRIAKTLYDGDLVDPMEMIKSGVKRACKDGVHFKTIEEVFLAPFFLECIPIENILVDLCKHPVSKELNNAICAVLMSTHISGDEIHQVYQGLCKNKNIAILSILHNRFKQWRQDGKVREHMERMLAVAICEDDQPTQNFVKHTGYKQIGLAAALMEFGLRKRVDLLRECFEKDMIHEKQLSFSTVIQLHRQGCFDVLAYAEKKGCLNVSDAFNTTLEESKDGEEICYVIRLSILPRGSLFRLACTKNYPGVLAELEKHKEKISYQDVLNLFTENERSSVFNLCTNAPMIVVMHIKKLLVHFECNKNMSTRNLQLLLMVGYGQYTVQDVGKLAEIAAYKDTIRKIIPPLDLKENVYDEAFKNMQQQII